MLVLGPARPVRNTQAVPRIGALTFLRFLTSKTCRFKTKRPKTQCKKSLKLSNSCAIKRNFFSRPSPREPAHHPPFPCRSFYVGIILKACFLREWGRPHTSPSTSLPLLRTYLTDYRIGPGGVNCGHYVFSAFCRFLSRNRRYCLKSGEIFLRIFHHEEPERTRGQENNERRTPKGTAPHFIIGYSLFDIRSSFLGLCVFVAKFLRFAALREPVLPHRGHLFDLLGMLGGQVV